MRRRLLVSAGLVLLAAGCARPAAYWKNRSLDLADGFAIEVGTGVGLDAVVRVTDWWFTGVGFSYSWKQGYIGRHQTHRDPDRDSHFGAPCCSLLVLLGGTMDEWHDWRWFWALLFPSYEDRQTHAAELKEWAWGFYRGGMSLLGVNIVALTEKGRVRGQEAKLVDAFELDVGATLIPVSARVGFSFGQFLDFLLGWTMLDIAGDDERPEPPPPTLQPSQGGEAPVL